MADRPDEDLTVPVAEAHVPTPRAGRFLVQLCRHAEAMSGKALHLHGDGAGQARPEVLHVECSDTEGSIQFNWGRCVLQSTSDTLTVRVEVADEDQLQRIQGLLAADLERFGRRDDLKVAWHRIESSAAEPTDTAAAPSTGHTPVRRKRGTTILLVVAVGLAVAAHVAFGGAALASWRWTSVAADILLAVVVLKIVVVALLARRRFRGHHARHGFPIGRHGAVFLRRGRKTSVVSQEPTVRSEARVPTSRADRYAKQLCSHAAWKTPRAEWTPPEGVIEFPDGMGTCRLTAEPDHLLLAVEATDRTNLARMQEIVGGLIKRFAGREDLTVEWSQD